MNNSYFIIYRFEIRSKQYNLILGTGSFKVLKEMTDHEKNDFFHQYTNGYYFNKQQFIKIEIK